MYRLLFGFVLLSFCLLYAKKPPSKEHLLRQRMSPEEVGKLYRTLRVIDLVFTKHNIPYWMEGGSLLGAVRHGGFIPWDDDGDLEFLATDYERILGLTDELAEYGVKLLIRPDLEQKNKSTFYIKEPTGVGMFPMRWREKEQVYHFDSLTLRKAWPHNHYKKGELFPLQRLQFGPIMLNAPRDAIAYLHRHYGKTVLDIAGPRRIPHHPVKDYFPLKTYKPAKYVLEDEYRYLFDIEAL